jgi:hypothetical protein
MEDDPQLTAAVTSVTAMAKAHREDIRDEQARGEPDIIDLH